MKYYELAYLISPLLTEEEAKTFQNQISALIQTEGGILGESMIVRRLLAYPIKGQTQAYFAVLDFQLNVEKLQGVEKKIKEEKQILRHLLLIGKKPRIVSRPEGVIPISRKEEKTATKKEKKVELLEIEKKLEEILDEPK
jgi:ribosomal protein S6